MLSGKLAQDLGAWVLNVSSSVAIIMANKWLMGSDGYLFNFVVTLTGLHFLASTGGMYVLRMLGYLEPSKPVPLSDMLKLVLSNCLCIVMLNLSLMINSVGFYQMAKLLNIPFVCLLEYILFSRRFSLQVSLSIVTVVAGVGVVTVSDISVNAAGMVTAGLSIVFTGIQQTTVSAIQKQHGITSANLLLKAGLPMGLCLTLLGPVLDRTITGQWVHEYDFDAVVIILITASCLIAILVNLSSFMCLGRFSAVTFQVMGHIKTVLVLAGGFVFFSEILSGKQFFGISCAVGGMIAYGYFTLQEKKGQELKYAAAPAGNADTNGHTGVGDEEEQPILEDSEKSD